MTFRRFRPRFRGLCAICDDTNETTQLCAPCYDKPENVDWLETWEDVDEDIESRSVSSAASLAEASDKKIRPATEWQQLIENLHVRGKLVEVKRVDARGRSRGVWYRRVDYTFREIAREVGCSVTYVIRTLDKAFK